MKKVLIAFLTVLFLFNCTGAGLLWLSQIHSHRVSVSTKKKHGPLVTVRYSATAENTDKYKSGKEFESDGKRYDVISVTKEGNELVLLCYDDTAEKHMLNELGKTTDSQQNSKEKNYSAKKAGLDYLMTDIQSLIPVFVSSELNLQPEQLTSSAPRTVPAPPPWIV